MPVSMSFKVMTWNIKTLGHNIPGRDYDQIAKLLAARDIICVQETKSHGFQGNAGPLFRAMSDRGFAWTVGEKTCDDDLPNAYEHPLIFYRALRFDLKAGSEHFLPMGSIPGNRSGGFGRNPYSATFIDSATGREMRVITYHGDTAKRIRLDEMRIFGRQLVVGTTPVIVCADRNFASKKEHDMALAQFQNDSGIQFASVNDKCYSTNNEKSVRRCPLDHIWVSPSVRLQGSEIGEGYGGMPLSDHRFVAATLVWK